MYKVQLDECVVAKMYVSRPCIFQPQLRAIPTLYPGVQVSQLGKLNYILYIQLCLSLPFPACLEFHKFHF